MPSFLATEGDHVSSTRSTGEFKIEAVKQVTERGHPVADVALLGVTTHSLYAWKAKQVRSEVPNTLQGLPR